MKELKIAKIRQSMNEQIESKGIITVVDTFIDIGILSKANYESWRKGQISYLERVCQGNLNKLSKVVREIFKYAKEIELIEKYQFYKKYGKGKIKLRFSKSGLPNIEKRYSTIFYKKVSIRSKL